MDSKGHIESALWLDRERQILLVRGWVVGTGSLAFPHVRWRQGERTVDGYAGIERPDLVGAFPEAPDAARGGFSLLGSPGSRTLTIEVEFSVGAGIWTRIAAIDPATITDDPDGDRETEIDSLRRAGEPVGSPVVLFITHDIAQAGAQLLLLRLLREFKKAGRFGIEVLVNLPRDYAPRASDAENSVLAGFEEIGPVHFLSSTTGAPENFPEIRAGRYGLVYANTMTLGCLLESLRCPSPLISHAHELGFWLEKRTGLDRVSRQVRHSDRIIACARAVQEYLTEKFAVPADAVETIHACASTARAAAVKSTLTKAAARAELGIPENAFVFAACGTFDWRKGAELFLPICVALRRLLPDREFHALWIGPFGAQIVKDQFDHEARSSGLEGKVALLGTRNEPLRIMRAADCFALPSREDPFPIVMLEAGTLGLPVVGFAGSGGVVEFAEDGAGLIVPYMDVEAFAAALARFAREPDLAERFGREAADRMQQLYDESIATRRILDLIARELKIP